MDSFDVLGKKPDDRVQTRHLTDDEVSSVRQIPTLMFFSAAGFYAVCAVFTGTTWELPQKRQHKIGADIKHLFYYISHCSDPNGASTQRAILDLLPAGGVIIAKQLTLFLSYFERDAFPQLTTLERSKQIRARVNAGESISDLASEYQLTPQRIHQLTKIRE